METHFTEKLEILLRNKPYDLLNDDEKIYVLSFISEEEYEHFSMILQGVVNDSKNEKNRLSLSKEVLSNLQDAFQEKHQPFYMKSMKFPFKDFQIPRYQVIAASLIFAIGIFSLLKPNEIMTSHVSTEYYLSEAEFNKYTQWDGFYSEMSEVTMEDDVTQELMNMSIPN